MKSVMAAISFVRGGFGLIPRMSKFGRALQRSKSQNFQGGNKDAKLLIIRTLK